MPIDLTNLRVALSTPIAAICDELTRLDELCATDFTLLSARIELIERAVDALAVVQPPVVVPTPEPVPAPVGPKLGAVSYYRAGPRWTSLINLGASKVGLTVLNPSSGPGAVVDQTYLAQVRAVQAAGIRVVGYLTSNYLDKHGVQTGETPVIPRDPRNLKNITDEMDRLMSMYQLDGFFIDELLNDATVTTLKAYQYLYGYAHSMWPGCTVVLNPGTTMPEAYMTVGDVFMTFESTAAKYRNVVVPGWVRNYSPSRFWHVVHSCPVAEMPGIALAARNNHAGLVWVTDDVLPNPYDTNPSYLDALVKELG